MEGTIVNLRGRRHTQYSNQMVISIDNITDREKATGLVGKKAVWTNVKGNVIIGKISSAHGNSGALRIIFEKGMPGQSLGKKVARYASNACLIFASG